MLRIVLLGLLVVVVVSALLRQSDPYQPFAGVWVQENVGDWVRLDVRFAHGEGHSDVILRHSGGPLSRTETFPVVVRDNVVSVVYGSTELEILRLEGDRLQHLGVSWIRPSPR